MPTIWGTNNTIYTVLTSKKGQVLSEMEEKGVNFPTLTDTILFIKNLLHALEPFHDHDLLHLDISPDNIFLLSPENHETFSTRLLLLDFNSAYSMDSKEYADDLGKSMPFDEFYKRMAEGAETKTSQVNVKEFIAYFTPFLEEGKDILHVCLSSGLSGVYNSANLAKEELQETFPDRKIYIIDSYGASSGYGLLMDKLADLRDEGKDIDFVNNWALDHRLHLHHWFFSTDLTFYVKGGRISKASGWFGTALHICPLLNMDNEGHLVPRFKIRGKRVVIKEIVKKISKRL